MPPLGLVALGGMDVIERPSLQVRAPAISVGDDIAAVAVALIERIGIKRGGGYDGTLAVLLQFGPLRQAILFPAESPQCSSAPGHCAMRPEVRLGQVSAPVARQLLGQALGFVRLGNGMVRRGPLGFQPFHILGIVGSDPGELLIAPPGGKAVFGSLDDDPVALLIGSGGSFITKGDPAGGDGRHRGHRQGQPQNCELEDTP